jgi:hypothetical protein
MKRVYSHDSKESFSSTANNMQMDSPYAEIWLEEGRVKLENTSTESVLLSV